MEPIKIGLLGLGTVGGGTVNVLTRNAQEIARRAGRGIQISHAAAKYFNPNLIHGLDQISHISDDAWAVVNDPEVKIIVELIGGDTIARDLILKAIENGKQIVTANKALIAKHGNAIFKAAQNKGVTVAFEAAVAGGIPIIKALREGLTANHIHWIAGIINGTANFILTEMRTKGRNFEEVLAEAQACGYAEADPTFDVMGIDAAHKLTILASIAFGIPLQFDKVYTEGINHIDPIDVAYAQELGYRIKLVGITKHVDTGIELRVHPALIPEPCLLANVDGVMNAVLVQGDAVGSTLYYGAGAGSEPTASAVVADIVDVVRTLTTDPEHRVPHLAFQPKEMSNLPILSIEQVETAYYLRLNVEDKVGVMAGIASILATEGISIEAIQQKEQPDGAQWVPLIMLTHEVTELCMNKAIQRIETLEHVKGSVVRIRLEQLDS
jgi:homoserine dehydrogenase